MAAFWVPHTGSHMAMQAFSYLVITISDAAKIQPNVSRVYVFKYRVKAM